MAGDSLQTIRIKEDRQSATGNRPIRPDRRWRGAVFYQIYPRSFYDSNDDGIGDLRGIIRQLDHVADLGVDGIWLCPCYRSPMKDFGYDVADYCDIDPQFGTLREFDELLAAAHARGLMVMTELVWSHTSDHHPWFADSRSSRNSERSEWYVWADPKPDGSPPNNWLSVFGGPAWTWDPRRRQYYLHHFLAAQPKLNLRNESVVEALLTSARFWLARGVDGFRIDAVDFMFHDQSLQDNPARAVDASALPTRPFAMQYHMYDMLHPDVFDFLSRLRRTMAEYPGTFTLGEVSSEPGAFYRCASYTDVTERRLDMAYSLGLMKVPLTPAHLRQVLVEAEAAICDGCLFWAFTNHDVVRAISRLGDGAADPRLARMLMALLTSLPGSACIYQGEELGLPEAELQYQHLQDPYGIAFYPAFKGRDGARTPLPWDAELPWAGFTRASQPWLPVPIEHLALSVARQRNDPLSTLNALRRFLGWRRQHPALLGGDCRILTLPTPLFGFTRRVNEEAIVAVFNLDNVRVSLDLEGLPQCTPLPGNGFLARPADGRIVFAAYDAFFGRIGE